MLVTDYVNLKGEDSWPSICYYDDMFQPGDVIVYHSQVLIILNKFTEHFKMLTLSNHVVNKRKQGIFGPLYGMI